MKRKMLVTMIVVAMIFSILPITNVSAYDGEEVLGLDVPQNVTVEVREHENGKPYFWVNWNNPQSAIDLVNYWQDNGEAYLHYQIDMKVGTGKWTYEVIGNTITGNALEFGSDNSDGIASGVPYDPISLGDLDTIDVKANVYQFRVRYSYLNSTDEDEYYIYSAFSNTATIGIDAYYEKASTWAVAELDKANEYGLIPAILKGADMTKAITREEFCELALLLYESTTGEVPTPFSPNPFTDTQNPQILKAFALGITKGTSTTTFTPKKTISRQECATMLFRTIMAIDPDADYSIVGVPDFPDQSDIDSWASDGTKYMSKCGIIKGDNRGYFMPKSTTTAQQASGYGTATREAAILMSVRTYEFQN